MSYVLLAEAKEYLGVYYSEKDDEIAMMIEAAERHVANFLGGDLSEFLDTNACDSVPDSDPPLLPNVKLGILQHIDGWFNNRGATQAEDLKPNESALQMLHFERKGLGV